jgi:cell wall-associated NlpC family hydrolase
MELKEVAKLWLFAHLNIPYRWGGDNPWDGYDCSGFAIEYLKMLGIWDRSYKDANAQLIMSIYTKAGTVNHTPDFGDLLFFGSLNNIHHVAIALDKYTMIEAGHGDSTCIDLASAKKLNARICVSAISRRVDLFTCTTVYNF